MFTKATYINRRSQLNELLGSGVILFPGNEEVGMNYSDNVYHFRQDSTFLYYFGIDKPGLTALIDVDNNMEIVFGDDPTIDEIVWTGPQRNLEELIGECGVLRKEDSSQLHSYLEKVLNEGRSIHYLPPYRFRNLGRLSSYFNKTPDWVNNNYSVDLIKAVVLQRSLKDDEEISELEKAVEITAWMHRRAMEFAKPGMLEKEIAAELNKIALESGPGLSFPCIITIKGEVLHNHYYGNTLRDGHMLLVDAGAESGMHYAGDMTRTFPISGQFSEVQRQIYQIVLDAQTSAIDMLQPGIAYMDVHLQAAKTITLGLQSLGIMKGDADEAIKAGAHGLFFQHGLGHMMGLDVHDMENLGELHVGYDEGADKSSQFGLSYLRLSKKLEKDYVLTVEPGIYFIPPLIEIWKNERKFEDFINYNEVEKFNDFGGIRIEDDYVITSDGAKLLGPKVPKTIHEIEQVRQEALTHTN